MISRRAFLLQAAQAAAGAYIAPSFYEEVLRHIEEVGQPLLTPPQKPRITLRAYPDDGYTLTIGKITQSPPAITWREYAREYVGLNLKRLRPNELEDHGIDPARLDEICDSEWYEDEWASSEGPCAQAHYYLSDLDIGPEIHVGGQEIGHLEFIEGPMPGSNYVGVRVPDDVSLSCLQQRLNQLGQNCAVVVMHDWDS